MSVLVVIHGDGAAAGQCAFDAVRIGQSAATLLEEPLTGIVVGGSIDTAALCGFFDTIWVPSPTTSTILSPGVWGLAVADRMDLDGVNLVVGCADKRGNEVLAHVGAIADLPFTTNVLKVDTTGSDWTATRYRWGGSLLEDCTISSERLVASAAPQPSADPPIADRSGNVHHYVPSREVKGMSSRLSPAEASKGLSLSSAPVVVSGGRGVGSAEGFRTLEELAELVGGAVGCSRVATNNGWRPHSDQVGQTGTKVSPRLYVACGISGAAQHWTGMMASEHILAINKDPEAPMMQKADFAVVADVAEFLPALVREIQLGRT
jgi:electron transfer flavoprotein alpha subunit